MTSPFETWSTPSPHLVHANGHDSTRTVQVGLRGDQFTEIRSGLGEGDQVVLAARR